MRKFLHFFPATAWMILMWALGVGLLSLTMAPALLSLFKLPNAVILVGRSLFVGAGVGVLFTLVSWIRTETVKKAWRKVFGATLLLGLSFPVMAFFSFPVVIQRGLGTILRFRGDEGLLEQLLMYMMELLYIVLTSTTWGFLLAAGGIVSAIVSLVALLLVVDRKPPSRDDILRKRTARRRTERPPTINDYRRRQRES